MAKTMFSSNEAERRARKVLPRILYDYMAGGAGGEYPQRANEAAFNAGALTPWVGTPVA